jgi:hypothetical protein
MSIAPEYLQALELPSDDAFSSSSAHSILDVLIVSCCNIVSDL